MKPALSNPTSGVAELLAKAADEFAKAAEAGRPPDIDEFVQRYPQIAAVLRDVLPALALFDSSLSESEGSRLGGEELIDRTLGDFRLIQEIGRGGMGVVYEAEQISLGRSVALKVLPIAGVLDEKQLQRFKTEARAAAALEHPHIVPVHSVGCERGVHYYAMRLIEGQSLAEILQAIPEYHAARSEIGDQKSEVALSRGIHAALPADTAPTTNGSPNSSPSPSTGEGRSEGAASDTRPDLQAIITTNAGFDSLVYFRNVAASGNSGRRSARLCPRARHPAPRH